MNKHFLEIMVATLAMVCIAVVTSGGCTQEPAAPQLPVGYQMPVAAPVVAPVPEPVPPPAPEPPPTPLTPIVEEATAAKGGAGAGVCRMAGPVIPYGPDALTNYSCKFDVELPFGVKPPVIDCALREQGDGSMTLGTSGGPSTLRGRVTEPKAGGFRLDGTWNYPGIKLTVGACMKRSATGFQGSGSGILNDDKSKKTKFKLTMTRK